MDQELNTTAVECQAAIKHFIAEVRASKYSTAGLSGTEFLEAESHLNESWGRFEALSDEDWEVIRSSIKGIDATCLWHYATRMAEMAVRRSDARLIHFGLMAVIADGGSMDRRDLFSSLALLMDAAKRIDADVETIFGNVARLGSPERRNTIEEYVSQRANESTMDHVLERIGFEAVGTNDLFTYRST